MVRKEIYTVNLRTEHQRRQLAEEVRNLESVSHENIVKYHERHLDNDTGMLYIYMDYCDKGDLGAAIAERRETGRCFSEPELWAFFVQICLALDACHNPKQAPILLHRDLKPDNVFLTGDSLVKLGDFGLSKALEGAREAAFAATFVGTPYYMSPELIHGKPYTTKSDIWSLGCVIYEAAALRVPFDATTHPELYHKIQRAQYPPLSAEVFSESLRDAISACLRVDYTARPSATQLLSLPQMQLARDRLHVAEREFKVSKIEHELDRRWAELHLREAELHKREAEHSAREAELLARQAFIDTQEARLSHREHELAESSDVFMSDSPLQEKLASTKSARAVLLPITNIASADDCDAQLNTPTKPQILGCRGGLRRAVTFTDGQPMAPNLLTTAVRRNADLTWQHQQRVQAFDSPDEKNEIDTLWRDGELPSPFLKNHERALYPR